MSLIDMHIHTTFSPCSKISIYEAMVCALDLGLTGIAITDHDTIEGALKAKRIADKYGIDVFVGCEVTSYEGHILAYGVSEVPPPSLPAEDTIDLIHRLGGVAVAAHPFRNTENSLGNRIFELPLDGIEVFNHVSRRSVNKEARTAAIELGLAQIGGSDAHESKYIGRVATLFGDDVHDEDSLVNAIRRKACKPVVPRRSPRHRSA
ncbi:MAG: PHP-associated domain-containing protein [Candidatus Freyarchaeota archaeon]